MLLDRLASGRRAGRRRRQAALKSRRLRCERLEGRLLLAQTTGLFFNDPGASDGYTLFSPNTTDTTYLIDKDGEVQHQWQSAHTPGLLSYMLEDGSLMRASAPNGQGGNGSIVAAGSGGLIERFDWEGAKIWEYTYDSQSVLQHHDIEVMPNGNVLLIAWEVKSEAEATQAGRDPNLPGLGFLYPDHIVEVEPDLQSGVGGTIVWEWHVWDHLVQEFDNTKDNWLGATGVEDHPELIDVNYISDAANGGGQAEDWTHANGIDYNADLDQIALSVREFSEIWIIDHSTTTAEAAGHTGGNSGKGGDLLYRWGNPEAYDTGNASDRKLWFQHDAKWIPEGLPGAGNITIFNNGFGRVGPGLDFTTIEEIAPPVDAMGNYSLTPGQAYGPTSTVWTYTAPAANYSAIISGTQRLENGNTLITYGVNATFTEVTPAGVEVWKYVSPYTADGVLGMEEPIDPFPFQSLFENFTFRAIDYPVDFFDPLDPPKVEEVFARGTGWNAGFLADLETAGLGTAADGFSIPVGNGDQLLALPWKDVDEVTIVFSEDVTIAMNDLSLEGTTTPNYSFSSFATGPGAQPGTFEATWTLTTPIQFDGLTINLDSLAIRDTDDQPLNGEWDNPADLNDPASNVYPSGDPLIGGDFQFNFNVLEADANGNGSVGPEDYTLWANNFGLPLDAGTASSDFNADGFVGPEDYTLWANNFGLGVPPAATASQSESAVGLLAGESSPSSAAAALEATFTGAVQVLDSAARSDSSSPSGASSSLPIRSTSGSAASQAGSATSTRDAFLPVDSTSVSGDGGQDSSLRRLIPRSAEQTPPLPAESTDLDRSTELRRRSAVDQVFGELDDFRRASRASASESALDAIWDEFFADVASVWGR